MDDKAIHYRVILLLLISILVEPTKIEIGQGALVGSVRATTKGRPFNAYTKIPYAKPPIGELRFENPVPPEKWHGTLNATEKAPHCPHPVLLLYMKDRRNQYVGQEDCLYVSVYTPKYQNEDLLPVMVFIHGGGFLGGASAMYEGEELLNEDVILVSINYRLGILGFLSTEDDVLPGNFGLKDQTMALKWVKENIEYFGGNPDSITIFGQSAGGASVHYHLLSPYSEGLFQRAILQAGTLLCPWTHSKEHREIAAQVASSVGCYVSDATGKRFSQKLVECLKKVDAKDLTKLFDKFMTWTFLPVNFGPRVDGDCIPDEPETLMVEARHSNVDIMIGVTRDEGAFLSNSIYSEPTFLDTLNSNFSNIGPLSLGLTNEDNAEHISKLAYEKYVGTTQASQYNADQITELLGDRHFKICSDLTALLHAKNIAKHGGKVFVFEFHHRSEKSLRDLYNVPFGKHWISHSEELYMLFQLSDWGASSKNKDDSDMSDIMVKLWTNFAKTGNPTPDGTMGFTWDPYAENSRRHLNINLQPQMEDDSREEIRRFWTSMDTKQNILLRRNAYGKEEL